MAKEPLAVSKFRAYLRIKTSHPKPEYGEALSFLEEYGQELGLDVIRRVELTEDRSALLMTWRGRDSSLPSILLNSHMDVAPVYQDYWKYDAFGAVKDDNGDIYARGAQDMKSVGIQHLEAVRKMKEDRIELQRDVHLSFLPDEQIGSAKGMCLLLKTNEFKKLNVGLVLDEGFPTPDDNYVAYCGERSPWWVRVKCKGTSGYATRFLDDTAGEKLTRVLTSFLGYQASQKPLFRASCQPLGDFTTINLTEVQGGGLAPNIVPDQLDALFDIRIPPSVDLKAFENKLESWCKEAGEGVSIEFIQKNMNQATTSTAGDNKWWNAFENAIKTLGIKLNVEIFSGFTDSRFLREVGYQAIGFSPMRNTPMRVLENDEFLNEEVFMEGIDAFCVVIKAVANLGK